MENKLKTMSKNLADDVPCNWYFSKMRQSLAENRIGLKLRNILSRWLTKWDFLFVQSPIWLEMIPINMTLTFHQKNISENHAFLDLLSSSIIVGQCLSWYLLILPSNAFSKMITKNTSFVWSEIWRRKKFECEAATIM